MCMGPPNVRGAVMTQLGMGAPDQIAAAGGVMPDGTTPVPAAAPPAPAGQVNQQIKPIPPTEDRSSGARSMIGGNGLGTTVLTGGVLGGGGPLGRPRGIGATSTVLGG